jgi:hypothetical protein
LATYKGIERSGPYLSVRDQLVCGAADIEKEGFEVTVLRRGNTEETRAVVINPTGLLEIEVICIYRR